MNKEEYLKDLEGCLKKHLSKTEIEDILRDYGEYFEDGRRMNQSDTEISARLGTPKLIAKQIVEEYGEQTKAISVAVDLEKMKDNAKKSMICMKGRLLKKSTIQKCGKDFKNQLSGPFKSLTSNSLVAGGGFLRGFAAFFSLLGKLILRGFCC